jgi:hypothetical protein
VPEFVSVNLTAVGNSAVGNSAQMDNQRQTEM